MLASSAPSGRTTPLIGEEVGPHAGTSGRRWIVDGIDGTHNYADGRPGWGTIVAYEVDGEIVVGLVSAPRFGRRWWAVRGGGAWSAPYRPDGSVDHAAAGSPAVHVGGVALPDASVIVIPHEGSMLGWRNDVAKQFTPPDSRRGASASPSTPRWWPPASSTWRSSCSAACGTSPPPASSWRGGRRLPRCVGRRAVRHRDRRLHQRRRWSTRCSHALAELRPDVPDRAAPGQDRRARRSAPTPSRRPTSGARFGIRPLLVDVGTRPRRQRAAAGPGHRRRAGRRAEPPVLRRHDRRHRAHAACARSAVRR